MAKAGCVAKIGRGCIAKIGGIAGTEGGALGKWDALQGCDRVHCKKEMHGTDGRGCIAKKGCIVGTERAALQR